MIIPAGQFKAKCLELVDQVSRTGEEIVITKRGKAVAKVVPVTSGRRRKGVFGCLAGTAKTLGNIISLVGAAWDAER